MNPLVVEIVGYVASVLVAWSLTMSNLVRLRWINLAGAVTFTIYGLMIPAYPVAAVNAFITVVNLRFLWLYSRQREAFDVIELGENPGLFERFLAVHGADLAGFFPEAVWPADDDGVHGVMVLRDLTPAGVVLWRDVGETVHVEVDYAAPPFRDFEIAAHVYDALRNRWSEAGATVAEAKTADPAMGKALTRAGFRPDERGAYRLELRR